MVKRAKRIEKGIEGLKKEIEEHFEKIEGDILKKNIDRGRYHVKNHTINCMACLVLEHVENR